MQLARAEGIEEIVILATCNRIEFLLWANNASLAANSVLCFLTTQYGLKLREWKNFYRLLEEAALLHIFRMTSSLDSIVVREPNRLPGQERMASGAKGRKLRTRS